MYGLENTATIVRGTLRKRGFCDAWNVFVQLGMTDDSYLIEGIENFSWREFTESFLPKSSFSVEANLAEYVKITQNLDIQNKLVWLGLLSDNKIYDSSETKINATPAQVLQKLLEEKWKLDDSDKDMCVMMHLMEYHLNDQNYTVQSSMVVIGEDGLHTAMAKTVGLPATIAVKMILDGSINKTGVVIPVFLKYIIPC